MRKHRVSSLLRRWIPKAPLLVLAISAAACSQNQPMVESNTQIAATAVESAIQPTAVPTPTTQSTNPDSDLQHFTNCTFRTGQNAIIGVPAEVSIAGDLALEPGDEIAVLATDGSTCAGASFWTGENIAITVWGDNSQTDALDGLLDGEELQFRIWDASADREFPVSAVTYIEGNGRYQTDGIYVVAGLQLGQP